MAVAAFRLIMAPHMSNAAKIEDKGAEPGAKPSPRPFASVIIPAYRAERFLEECLASVRDQSFSDLECIVVDDASPESDSLISVAIASTTRTVPDESSCRHHAGRAH